MDIVIAEKLFQTKYISTYQWEQFVAALQYGFKLLSVKQEVQAVHFTATVDREALNLALEYNIELMVSYLQAV